MADDTACDPWQVPHIGAIDPMGLTMERKAQWCHEHINSNFWCNRPKGHKGHHVGSSNRSRQVYYIMLVIDPTMCLPEGF